MAISSSSEKVLPLFTNLTQTFPSQSLGDDKWYLIALAALTGAGKPELAPDLYLHLISQPSYSTSSSRQALTRRLRETLVKCVAIYGVCRPLEAIFAIDSVQREEDKDYSFSRENWQCDAANYERGTAWLGRIYTHNMAPIDEKFKAQKDFGWISRNITYGLYLSDHSILNDIETELVVLAGIMIQNLKNETAWHLRGSRRVGISNENVEKVHQCIELIADFAGVKLDKVPRVADVEHEV
ncbi:hypothetical protein K432DRAFT_393012 [Lepidopterella palustris CBS 459.81]|uniref:Carboxymuconolactone decarboxylase-like domain-containing protein n=1 Tax=Lepidopterella palustris CBS 459.81 TaxID=1314670 RepID=A0A8E2JFH9_9PEZI|nr:hypothetical protein K432DRAFT_393012 [Lepidopterella palustris CBS 459.81]